MNKYQITHYWSDENTFPETIEQYTIKAKNEDNVEKQIKKGLYPRIQKEIYDIGCYPTVLTMSIFHIDDKELTQEEFSEQYPEIDLSDNMQEKYPYIINYNWEIIQIDN